MQGDMVIARAYGGVPLIRRVWDEDDRGVYIVDDARFQRLLRDEDDMILLGFPREDVFKFDKDLARQMTELIKEGQWDWNRLTPF